jgi:hypothetical protein
VESTTQAEVIPRAKTDTSEDRVRLSPANRRSGRADVRYDNACEARRVKPRCNKIGLELCTGGHAIRSNCFPERVTLYPSRT